MSLLTWVCDGYDLNLTGDARPCEMDAAPLLVTARVPAALGCRSSLRLPGYTPAALLIVVRCPELLLPSGTMFYCSDRATAMRLV